MTMKKIWPFWGNPATDDSRKICGRVGQFQISMHVSYLQLKVMKLSLDGHHWSIIQVTEQQI